MGTFITELKRRNVVKVAVFYVISAWLALQAGDVLFDLLQLPDWSLRLVLGVLILGLPIALAFSWIYEMTPEGIKREKDIDRNQSITPQTGQKINIAIMVGLAVAIGLMLYQQFGPQRAAAPQGTVEVAVPPTAPAAPIPAEPIEASPSVAVLPFVNMSPDKDQEFFADGLSDTLMHVLAQVRGLKVAARTSSFAFKGKNINVADIAQELGVANILEGSVQTSGNKVRVIAQLIDASDGSHLWSANFDRSLEDIFVIQDEIAHEVVKALKVTLLAAEETRLAERYQPTLEAYEQLILGRQEMAKRTADSLAAAEARFARAIELDPDYALAYVGLADTLNLQVAYSGLVFEEGLKRRQALVDKALELDPLSGEAYTELADILLDQEEMVAAEEAFLMAIELNPGYPTARHWYSILLDQQGRFDEQLAQVRMAAELDPMSPIIQHNVATAAWNSGRVEEGLAVLRRNIERFPEFANSYGGLAGYQTALGQLGQAQVWSHEALRINPGNPGRKLNECFGYLNLGDRLSAEDCSRQLNRDHPGKFQSIWAETVLSFYRQEWPTVIAQLESVLERTPGFRFPTGLLADFLAGQGEIERARQLMTETFPELLEQDLQISAQDLFYALNFAAILDAAGETAQRDVILAAMEAQIATMHRIRGVGYGVTDIYIHHMRGDRERALAGLREAIDMGWRNFWWSIPIDWKLGNLPQDPEFIAMIGEIEADILQQRAWYEEHKDQPCCDWGL